MKIKLFGLAVLLALMAFGYLQFGTDTRTQGEAASAGGIRQVVENVAIKNYGEVIYRGSVDLTASIERIRAGIQHPHRNDGSVFGNRERLLPQKPRGYYREYVHPTDDLNGPGPQRLVVGDDGDWWYTPDHYASFIELGVQEP
ncbi:MAG: ribonuclease [Acidobacteriota bacterium]|nr:ribonuclease [Acidobacteriota bacterium]MDH3784597.1 ribonuclease [Acidobacteriota bacterium]